MRGGGVMADEKKAQRGKSSSSQHRSDRPAKRTSQKAVLHSTNECQLRRSTSGGDPLSPLLFPHADRPLECREQQLIRATHLIGKSQLENPNKNQTGQASEQRRGKKTHTPAAPAVPCCSLLSHLSLTPSLSSSLEGQLSLTNEYLHTHLPYASIIVVQTKPNTPLLYNPQRDKIKVSCRQNIRYRLTNEPIDQSPLSKTRYSPHSNSRAPNPLVRTEALLPNRRGMGNFILIFWAQKGGRT